MPPPFFSIVIPTRNESADILRTLESIRDNSFQEYEVLVVDASTDDTREQVARFRDPRVRVLPQDNREGRCGARNQGILAAQGEVAVILNADVRLPSDFLARLKQHYDAGADYVIVEAEVENTRHPNGAMVQAEHLHLYRQGRETVNWCEGYSCRRRCAIAAGLFPTGHPIPICAGEDAVFGEKMAALGKRKEDFSLVVTHEVPEEFEVYWDQRVGRGEGCAQRRVYLDRWPLWRVFAEGLVCTVKSAAWIGLVFPMLHYCRNLHLNLPSLPAWRFIWPVFISRFAHEVGRWDAFCETLKRL
ncbi:MAG: glycosyltransferase family 2 protein [Verrucomicrobiae bacterium]|nr:glycosyltransferase family 2 protein [Verrucomicrobiae bacterium]